MISIHMMQSEGFTEECYCKMRKFTAVLLRIKVIGYKFYLTVWRGHH